jgi:hypothetical protein
MCLFTVIFYYFKNSPYFFDHTSQFQPLHLGSSARGAGSVWFAGCQQLQATYRSVLPLSTTERNTLSSYNSPTVLQNCLTQEAINLSVLMDMK